MQDQSWFNLVASVIAVAVLAGGVVSLLVMAPGPAAPTPAAAGTQAASVYRNLTIAYDPSTGSFSYSSTALAVPLHTRVVFSITNFDPGVAMLPSTADAQVTGTMGGTMALGLGANTSVTQISPSQVSHTFTIPSPFYKVNVPIPSAAASGAPTRVTFAVTFNVPGTFSWGCVVLCGGTGMDGPDSMFGTLTVS